MSWRDYLQANKDIIETGVKSIGLATALLYVYGFISDQIGASCHHTGPCVLANYLRRLSVSLDLSRR
jgi:hypothetical protein